MEYTPFHKYAIEEKILQWNKEIKEKIFSNRRLKAEYYLSVEEIIYKITNDWIAELRKYGANYMVIVNYQLFKAIQCYLELEETEPSYQEQKENSGYLIILSRIKGNKGLNQRAHYFLILIETCLLQEKGIEVYADDVVNLADYETWAKRYLQVRKMLLENPNSEAYIFLTKEVVSGHFTML